MAYRMQVEMLGGLSPRAERKLRQVAEAKQAGDKSFITLSPRIKPGTKLIRVWQDKTHTVTALHDGFEWQGSRYRSLSEVARSITGTRWNGLIFFGVKPRPSSNKNARNRPEVANA
jgi:plastocyanin